MNKTQRRAIKKPRNGGIVAALRRSPLAGANLDFKRPRKAGRKIKL
ncbi:MAG TPA: hypothetical protein VHA07_09555 [Devosia sp.]|nr:hypothetical protein [Devosia sp.]